jgi:hypothetical protein
MALQMLWMHWRTVRFGLIPFIVAAFALPLLLVQGLGPRLSAQVDPASVLFYTQEIWVAFFPILATAVGLVLGLSAWNWDHKLGHVYALSLPVARSRYSLMKYGAGAVLAIIPAAALLVGSVVALSAVKIPAGLQAYPLPLTGHFLFASLLVYTLVFSLASGTVRTTVIAMSMVVGVPLVATILANFMSTVNPAFGSFDLGYWLTRSLEDFGPFRILMGNWSLIDV